VGGKNNTQMLTNNKKPPHQTQNPLSIWCHYLPPSNYLNRKRRKPWAHAPRLLVVSPLLTKEWARVRWRW